MVARVTVITGLLIVSFAVFAAAYFYRSDLAVDALKARDPSLVPAASKFLPLANGSIHYRDQGLPHGPPLLLIPDFDASLESFEPWVAALGDRYRLISVDPPGQGLTGAVAAFGDDTANAVAFLRAFVTALDLPPVTLVGNGRGGEIAWRFALHEPKAVSRLVLIAPSGLPTPQNAPEPWLVRIARLPIIGGLVASAPFEPYVRARLAHVYADDRRVTERAVARDALILRATGNRETLLRRLTGVPEKQAPIERLAEITIPTLVLWGADDDILPAAQAIYFDTEMPAAQIVVLEHVGHRPQEEAPEDSAGVFASFMIQAPDAVAATPASSYLRGGDAPPLRAQPLKPVETAPLAPLGLPSPE